MRSIYTFALVTNELTIWALKYAYHTLNFGQPPPAEEGHTILLVKVSLPPELSTTEKEKKGKEKKRKGSQDEMGRRKAGVVVVGVGGWG